MFEKQWRQFFGCLGDWQSSGMRGVGSARTMIEQHVRKGTWARWLPEESLEEKLSAGDLNGLRSS